MCPSGTSGQIRDDARGFVRSQLRDAPRVTLNSAERGGEEYINDGQSRSLIVHSRSDSGNVGVIVLSSQRCGLLTPHQCGAYASDTVRGNLLTVTRTTNHDTQTARVGNYRFSSSDARARVIVLSVVNQSPVVNDLVPLTLQVRREGSFEFESGMV